MRACVRLALTPPRRYNPVLGEFFRCRYDYSDGSRGFYIAEQGPFLPHPLSPRCRPR